MNKAEASRRITRLKEQIRYHNDRYYNQDVPEISDAAYDMLTQELRALEDKYPELAASDSPSKMVGGAPQSTFAKVEHAVPMLSLLDVFSDKEVVDFTAKNPNTLYDVEDKIDGLSICVTYQKTADGRWPLIRGETRGDGRIGEDITENAKGVMDIPLELKCADNMGDIALIEVRAEVYMFEADLADINIERELLGKKRFKNTRNAAAGLLRTKDLDAVKNGRLRAFAFNVQRVEYSKPNDELKDVFSSHAATLSFLRSLGFNTVNSRLVYCDGVLDIIREIGESRSTLPFGIDGAVVKIDSIALRETLGAGSKYPAWAVAFKYPPEWKETVVRDIVVQAGRTGVLTPKAVFDPVQLAGTTVTCATLHNQAFMDDALGGIGIGDKIRVHKSGDIIPEVLQVLDRPADRESFKITTCPVCGAEAVLGTNETGDDAVAYVCPNDGCPSKLLKHIEFWASRDVMDIEGMGPAVINALTDAGLVNSVADLYRLKLSDIIDIKVIGPVRGPKLLSAIEASKTRDIDRLIKGLGIPGVGRHVGAALAKVYPDIHTIARLTESELSAVDGSGDITAAVIHRFFDKSDNMDMVHTLEELGLNMKSLRYGAQSPDAEDAPFAGKTFVITGTLPTMDRNQASQYIEERGGKVSGSVSKKTSYLVAGEAAGSKLTKARDLGVAVLTEEELKALAKG